MKKRKGDIEESAHFGQTIRTETSARRSSHKVDESAALSGGKFGGGPTDVSHSLSGAGQVQNYNDVPPKSGNKHR